MNIGVHPAVSSNTTRQAKKGLSIIEIEGMPYHGRRCSPAASSLYWCWSGTCSSRGRSRATGGCAVATCAGCRAPRRCVSCASPPYCGGLEWSGLPLSASPPGKRENLIYKQLWEIQKSIYQWSNISYFSKSPVPSENGYHQWCLQNATASAPVLCQQLTELGTSTYQYNFFIITRRIS